MLALLMAVVRKGRLQEATLSRCQPAQECGPWVGEEADRQRGRKIRSTQDAEANFYMLQPQP